jgi:hypothetical protein
MKIHDLILQSLYVVWHCYLVCFLRVQTQTSSSVCLGVWKSEEQQNIYKCVLIKLNAGGRSKITRNTYQRQVLRLELLNQ